MDFWVEVEEPKLTGRGNQSQTVTGKSVIRSKQGCRADTREQIKNNLASPCVFLYFFFSFSIQVLFKGIRDQKSVPKRKFRLMKRVFFSYMSNKHNYFRKITPWEPWKNSIILGRSTNRVVQKPTGQIRKHGSSSSLGFSFLAGITNTPSF